MSHLFNDTMDDAWRHERFVVTIQQTTGIGWDKAERAAQATLETLAERVSAGVARDLAGDLPVAERRWLQPQGDAQPLDPGRDRTGGKAQKMPLDEFLHSVADREGVAPEDVLDHVQAVFKTIREIVPEKTWSHLLAQLPHDWTDALAPAPAPKHH
jgi:uncharacterized protein (DUF2267 family)